MFFRARQSHFKPLFQSLQNHRPIAKQSTRRGDTMKTRQMCATCLYVHYDHTQTNDSFLYPYHLSLATSFPPLEIPSRRTRKPNHALQTSPPKTKPKQPTMGCGPSKPSPPPRYISYPKQQPNYHLAPLPPKPTRAPNARLDGPFQMAYPVRKSQMPMARKPVPRKPVPRVRDARLNGPFQMEYPIRRSQMW